MCNMYLHIYQTMLYYKCSERERCPVVSIALHQKVAEHIRSQISSGEYEVGSQLPTENELAIFFGVSRPTIRQALGQLAQEGYVKRIKGSGTFAADPNESKVIHESTRFITSYREESQRHNRVVRTRVLAQSVERASEEIARKLNIPINAKVNKMLRVRHLEGYHDNAPVVYTILYVPYKLFPDFTQIDFTDLSFYDVLQQRDLDVRHAVRKLEVIPSTEEIVNHLKISAFEPVIYISSVGYTAKQIPIEYTESYYPAGTSSFSIEINR